MIKCIVMKILLSLILIIGIAIIVFVIFKNVTKTNEKMNSFLSNQEKFSAKEFLSFYERMKVRNQLNFRDKPGIYIIHNVTKNKYYVGQSRTVLKRVRNHFSGSGNGDVYADFKYNDEFFVSIIPCDITELNEMESRMIKKYRSHIYGYNKNKGINNKNFFGW